MRTACMLWGNVKPGWSYTLPVASPSVLGGIKIGLGLTIDGTGVVSVTGGSGTVTSFSATGITGVFTTSVATAATTPALSFALVSKNANRVFASPNGVNGIPSFRQIEVNDLQANGTTPTYQTAYFGDGRWAVPYTLPTASGSILGGIKVGSGLSIDGSGVLSATGGLMVYPGAGLAKSTGSGWATSITDNSANWNTAYSWGNHAGLYAPLSHKTTEDALNGLVKVNGAGGYSAVTDNSTNWNSAYTNMGKVLVNGLASYYTLSDVYFLQEYGYIRPAFGSISYANPLPVTGGAIYGALAAKQDALTFTTAGTSGAATLIGNALNIPNYTLAGLGGISDAPSDGSTYGRLNGAWSVIPSSGTNYWQTGAGYIAPADIGNEVRIGQLTDQGAYKLQVKDGIINDGNFHNTGGTVKLYHYENTNSPNRALYLYTPSNQYWPYSRETAISFNPQYSSSSAETVEAGLFSNYLHSATVGSRKSIFKWYVLNNDALTNVMTLDYEGTLETTKIKVSALNTAPTSATATGTTGEIRVTAGYIYVCTATNTWVRAALATW